MRLLNSENYFEIFKKCLGTGATADMATAYFSCYMFELFKNEFKAYFTTNNKIRIIIGSDTSIEELQFIQNIEKLKDEEITDYVLKTYFEDLKLVDDDTLQIIHSLFSKRLIDIRVGFSSKSGIFHSKFYIFKDETQYNVLNGSLNFTRNALFNNFEFGQLMEDEVSYKMYTNSFNNIWNNIQQGARCEKLNEVILKKLNDEATNRNMTLVTADSKVKLRDYQDEAIDSLLRHDMNGFLKMATGTGKTFTSIYALKKYKEKRENKNIISHIVVPYKHLADQWRKSIFEVFTNAYIIECHSENSWRERFNNIKHEAESKDCFAVFVNNSFNNNTRVIERGITDETILIVDEAHNLTIQDYKVLNEMGYQHTVGLSATPKHYIENERTEKLFEFFKGETFDYGLENAIESGYLTKYNYYPILVNLDEEEIEKYKKLDIKIKGTVQKCV